MRLNPGVPLVGVLAICALALGPMAASADDRVDDQVVWLLSLERDGFNKVAAQHVSRLTRPAAQRDPTAPTAVRYSSDWLASVSPPADIGREAECLTVALYHEARGEDIDGQFAVAEVILNRVDSPAFPGNICGVVHQGANGASGGRCQFSFACDGKSTAMRERGAREIARKISHVMVTGAPRRLTQGATHFHTTQVAPRWSRVFERTARFGAHIFYRDTNT